MEVQECNSIRKDKSVKVEHVYREGNNLADYFANLAVHFAGTKTFNLFQEVPIEGRKIINMDKK